jgi:hypothetical protein
MSKGGILHKRGLLLAAGAAAALIGVAVSLWLFLPRPSYNIPKTVLEQNAFAIFVPTTGSPWQIDESATKYIEDSGVLSFKFVREGYPSIAMTQQAKPAVFDDVPNYYSIMLNKLHEYRQIDTQIGAVTLTHPEELKGEQSAVGNLRGTLFFAHPEKDLTDDQWKDFFSSLKVLR